MCGSETYLIAVMKWLSSEQEMKENGELESVLPKTQSLDERYGPVSIRKRYQLSFYADLPG